MAVGFEKTTTNLYGSLKLFRQVEMERGNVMRESTNYFVEETGDIYADNSIKFKNSREGNNLFQKELRN